MELNMGRSTWLQFI
jgi:hypothetical protein